MGSDTQALPDAKVTKDSVADNSDNIYDNQTPGAVVFLVLFNAIYFSLRLDLVHYAYPLGIAAIPLLKVNTRKVGHAASTVEIAVIGALVASYAHLSTTLEITTGNTVIKFQADVVDKRIPAFLPLPYILTMYGLVRRGWSPLQLIGLTVY